MRSILILDPRGILNSGDEYTTLRHDHYAQELNKNQKLQSSGLVVVSRGKTIRSQPKDYKLIVIKSSRLNLFLFAYKSAKAVKEANCKPGLVVAGDPWEGAWSARLFNIFFGKRLPVQVQLHGDFGNPIWRTLNVKNRLKFLFLQHSLKYADSVRVVGHHQAEFIERRFRVPKEIISVCPLTLNLSVFPNYHKSEKNGEQITLAFVGRLHEERGISLLLEIVGKLSQTELEFNLVVVGKGPQESKLKTDLSKILSESRFEFSSHLTVNEMHKLWLRADLLLNLAPAESYGRTIREALYFGVPVYAIDSSGVRDLVNEVGGESVRTIQFVPETSKLISEIISLVNAGVSAETREKLDMMEQVKNTQLIDSWAVTIQKFGKQEEL